MGHVGNVLLRRDLPQLAATAGPWGFRETTSSARMKVLDYAFRGTNSLPAARMRYLIDGYNLLYATGLVGTQTTPQGVGFARARLVDMLHVTHKNHPGTVTLVFDAERLPRGAAARQNLRGIEVFYAVHHLEADDLLEELIAKSSTPGQMVVVSNDRRVQSAARRRGCQVTSCSEYMDWLLASCRRSAQAVQDAEEKPTVTNAAETAHWVQAFGSLDQDAAMRELFDIPWSSEPPKQP